MLYLTAVRGGEAILLDSAKTLNGKVTFKSDKSPLRGMYRLYLNDEKYFEVILSNELTQITTTYENPIEDLQVIFSRENRCYYYYINKMVEYERPLAELYEQPDVDQVYLGRMTDSVIRQKNFYSKELARNFPETYAAKLIKSLRIPERADYKIDEILKYPDRISFMKAHAFDNINFGDSELLRSDIFHYSIKYYLDNLVTPQNEENYILACDKIMAIAYKNKNVYNYVLDLLMNAFAQIRMDVVYTHLAERYMLNDQECSTSDTSHQSIKERVALLKLTEVGAQIPPLSLPDFQGRLVNIDLIKSKFTLLMFWSTKCKHCEKALPEIKKMYNEYKAKGFQVYAVNLDSSMFDWLKVIGYIDAGWINTISINGIDHKDVANFAIRGTPKYFLLNSQKQIMTKPKNLEELKKDLLLFLK
ncbi:MAG: redoxin domain-containing protein [Bacteroidetes bacterium]|nr:redoxin domain-containing protein [Bacteroidota bacterium]